jgi:ribonucleotide monophosphatase NagD (HAD superfamily)
MHTAVVLSGVTTPELLADSPIQPDLVFDSLADLLAKWQACCA